MNKTKTVTPITAGKRKRKIVGSDAARQASDFLSLEDFTSIWLTQLFDKLGGLQPTNLHDAVLQQVERPLIAKVMQYFDGNQVQASKALGINRATLKKKIEEFGLEIVINKQKMHS
jgi:Fis family transcriptional regulator